MEMTMKTFASFRDLIYEKSGIYFPDNKKYVLDSRLASCLAEHNCATFDEYLALLKTGGSRHTELPSLFNAITTNETFFFRDLPQLQAFNEFILPTVLKEKQGTKQMKIWSAACSTGEEPYTLAILLLERFRDGARLGAPGAGGWNGDGARLGAPGAGGWNGEGARPLERSSAPTSPLKSAPGAVGWKEIKDFLRRAHFERSGSSKLGLAEPGAGATDGCTGQDLKNWSVEIVASDLSEATLASARGGCYGSYAMRHVPPAMAERYFTAEDGLHLVRPTLRRLVRFANINLFDRARVKLMSGMDIIFCRNCLIYFDDKAKKRVLDSLYDCLNPNGFLVIGFSESLHSLTRAFRPIPLNKTVVYQKI
jgi:chemotaxis methyl-accepting protein methylase